MLALDLAGERIQLLPERAMFWHARRTLFIADLHLGKPAAFAAAGVPVPHGTTEADLTRLGTLIDRFAVARVVVLGDLLHARTGRDQGMIEAVTHWRARHARVEFLLVRGNHDLSAGDPPPSWRCDVTPGPLRDGPFTLAHEPSEVADTYTLAGHLHPVVSLSGPGRDRLRAHAFVIDPRSAILPAFGSFTGGSLTRAQPGRRLFVTGGGTVIEVRSTPPTPAHSSGAGDNPA